MSPSHVLAIVYLVLLFPLRASAQRCEISSGGELQTPIAKPLLASASLWMNTANRPGSLRFESARMLKEAVQELDFKKQATCEAACVEDKAYVVFKSVPHQELQQYRDRAECEKHLQDTTKNPLVFPQQSFSELSMLSDWIGDFSQGKGQLGEELYRRCPGNCSPQYTYYIETKDTTYLLRPTVVCGHARDKSDNQYELTYSVTCGTVPEAISRPAQD